jgi:hypothetical protein
MTPPLDRPLRILFLSTSVGALGTGLGGGVELTLHNMAQALSDRQHTIVIVAPTGSVCASFPWSKLRVCCKQRPKVKVVMPRS